jgi:hypothetical protein
MARRILSRINSAHVIATIALFAALGGGYAVAFKGSGTLQKAKADGFGATKENVRSITGIGQVRASCEGTTMSVDILNTSGETMSMHGWHPGGDFRNNFSSGVDSQDMPLTDTNATGRWHVHPLDPDQKRPQADIVTSVDGLTSCGFAGLAVMVLNTEE